MRATFLLTATFALAATLSGPAFAQVSNSNTTVTAGEISVPIAIGTTQAVTNRVVEPVTPSFDTIISAPVEYDENGVAKAQYFKASDLTPEQNAAFQDEVRRVRTYQSRNGNAPVPSYIYSNGTSESSSESVTYGSNAPVSSGSYEIELYDTGTPIYESYEYDNVSVDTNYDSVNVITEPVAAPLYANATHTVAKGDTLYNLSKRYEVTVAQLQAENGMSNTNLSLGQSLRIPSSAPSAVNTGIAQPIFVSAPVRDGAVTRRIVQPVATVKTPVNSYAVLKKDTLYSIAKRACVSVNDLAAQNGISDPSSLQLGQKLELPLGHCQKN